MKQSVRAFQSFQLRLFAMFHLGLFFFRHSKSSDWGSSIIPVHPELMKRGLNHFPAGGEKEKSVESDPTPLSQREFYPSSQWHRCRDQVENHGQQFLASRYQARQSLYE